MVLSPVLYEGRNSVTYIYYVSERYDIKDIAMRW